MPPSILNSLTWTGAWGTLDLQTLKVYFDLVQGFNEYPEVKGRDDVVPGRPGRYRRNRVDDRAIIELRGWVRGIGATPTARRQDFRATVTALRGAMDPTGGAGTLAVLAPYLGLVSGSQSIVAYPLSIMGGEVAASMAFQRFSIELESVANPPRWA